jgi:hypothetical protein
MAVVRGMRGPKYSAERKRPYGRQAPGKTWAEMTGKECYVTSRRIFGGHHRAAFWGEQGFPKLARVVEAHMRNGAARRAAKAARQAQQNPGFLSPGWESIRQLQARIPKAKTPEKERKLWQRVAAQLSPKAERYVIGAYCDERL